ncbi:MAG: DUF3027 domain-containing protein [Salinibacterium sp.]|nr:MAG: DUF3027 domain-containing protein [Salinibacterium sp.]
MPNPYEDLAREALLEITTADTIGDYVGQTDEGGGAVSVLFASKQPGYPGWIWTVSVADVEGSEPTVLEAELMPGEDALLAPDWVPWSDRLAEYEAAQELLGEASDGDEDDADESDADEDDDEDVVGSDVLHGGDLDGVDIDDLDDEDDDDDGEEDEDDLDEDESDEFDDNDDEPDRDRSY